MDASIALGDYYYNKPDKYKEALVVYFKAKKIEGITILKISSFL